MFCPNDKTSLHQATVPSHYGQQLVIDQCGGCGGIWFDAFELYKVKHGEAETMEGVDVDILRAPVEIENKTLLCPRDKTPLVQFDDPRFPSEIILSRCSKCQGFWLNRGVFTRYQEARQNRIRPREKTPDDLKLEESVKRMLQTRLGTGNQDVLTRVGKFLSAPAHQQSIFPTASRPGAPETGTAFDSILNILILILRLFILR